MLPLNNAEALSERGLFAMGQNIVRDHTRKSESSAIQSVSGPVSFRSIDVALVAGDQNGYLTIVPAAAAAK